MKKRFVGIGVATALTMSLGTAGLAFGVTTINGTDNDLSTAYVSSPLEVIYTAPAEYVITIPTEISLDTPAVATLKSGYVLPSGKSLKIEVTDLTELSNGKTDALASTLGITTTNKSLTVNAADDNATDKSLSTTFTKSGTAKFADKYTGSVTYEVSLV